MKKKLSAVLMVLFLAFAFIPVATLTATETYAAASTSVATVKLGSIKANSSTKVTLTWKKVSGANGYRVYRKTSGTSWKALKTVGSSTLSYADTSAKAGTKYTYTVRAYKKVSGKNYWGGYDKKGLTVTTPKSTSVATVKLGSIKANSSNKVTLTWKKVSGANGYRVYRKTSGTSWKALKTVGSGTLSYTDTSAKAGTKYTYTVRAYKKVSGKNYWGGYDKKGLTVTTPKSTSVATVKLGSIKANSSTKVTLTWKKVSGANGYRVYRKTSGTSWKALKTVGSGTLSYTDTSAKAGTKYTYTVRAYKKVSGKNYWGGYDKKGLTVTTPKNTSVATVKLGSIKANSSNKVTLTWKKVSGTNGYRVYRKTSGTSWKALKTVGSSTLSYADTSVKAGTKYTYTVRAYKKVSGKNYWGGYDKKGLTVTTPKAASTAGWNGFYKKPGTSTWYYYKNGKISTGTTSIIKGKVNGTTAWWYVEKGKVGTNTNTVAKNSNGWYVIQNGKVNFSYTGFAKNSNGTWYIQNGKVNFNYSGTIYEPGKKYTVKDGKLTKTENCTHKWDSGKVTTKPTCTKKGIKTYTCTVCKKTKTEDIQPAHTWDTGKVTKEPTCTEKGEKLLTCTVCGDTKTEDVAALGHDLKEEVTTEPTCGDTGVKTITCSRCDYHATKEIPATGKHTWDDGEITTEPTCEGTGEKTFTCTVCDDTKTEDVEPLGHDLKEEVTTKPTCGDTGVKTITCSRCDYYATEEIPATGEHVWNDGEVTTEPTCTKKGVMTYTCTVCGNTKTEDIDATGIHTWDEGKVTTEPTCTEKGVRTYTCSGCGDTKTEDIEATGIHNWVHHDEVGHEESKWVWEEWYECKGCGMNFGDDDDAAIDHCASSGCHGPYHLVSQQVEQKTWIVDTPAYDSCSMCGATK